MHNQRSSNSTDAGRRLRRSLISLAIGGMFAGATQLAAAQTAAPPPPPPPPADAAADTYEVQEVVVTATKRSESAQKVPLAITAIGSQELQDRGITGLSGLTSGAVPTLKLEQFAGNPTTIEVGIRGFINPNGTDISTENPVPIYIDDIYNGRQQGAVLDLTEIDSLSVLRGPQGTLFGKNAMGGAVQVNSKRPTGRFGIRSQVEGGSFGYYKAIAHLDLPRIGDVAAKIDFIDTDSNGWQKNPEGAVANGNQTYTGTAGSGHEQNFGRVKAVGQRLALRYDPTENITIDYAGLYIRSQSTGAYNQLLSSNDPYTNSVWPSGNKRADSLPYPVYRPLNNEQFVENHITASWFVSDRLTIKSITAYRDDSSLDFNTASPSSTVPGVFLGRPDLGVVTAPTVTYDIQHKQFSQEFQFIGTEKDLQWTAGLFFMNERGTQVDNTYFGLAFPNATTSGAPGFVPITLGTPVTLNPAFALGSAAESGADVQNISAAGFANAVWRPEFLERRLAVTAGLRLGMDEKRVVRPVGYVWDQVTYPAVQGAPAPVPGQTDPTTGQVVAGQTCPCSAASITERRSLPLAVVSYDWADSQSAYLRYSTGYRAAAFGLASQTLHPAQADSANSFELGQKSEFWGHRARVNVAAFYTRWKGPQQSVQTASTSTVEFFNGPTIQVRGVELDSSFVPLDGLTISVNGAYYHGHQPPASNPFPPPGGSSGVAQFNNVVNLPAFSGSASVLYDFLKTSYGTWRANVDVNGTSGYFGVPNTPLEIPGYGLVNARFGLANIKVGTDSGSMDLMVFGQNLTDKSYEVFNYSAAGTAPGTESNLAAFGQKRLVGAALSYRY
jgi:iron complex outermembrane receptor protein